MRARVAPLALLAAVALAAPAAAQTPTITKSDNVREVGRHAYTGGTEIAFDGRWVYAGQFNGTDNRNQLPQQGGFKIFDTKDGTFRLAGELPCPATDSDVTLVRPGLVAVAHHTGLCNPTRGSGGSPTASNNGVYLADVSDPENVEVLGGVGLRVGASQSGLSAHTVTVHPSGEVLYINPGGLQNGQGITTIVDIRNPRAPRIAGRFAPDDIGCHDLQFLIDERGDFAFCAGLQKVEVWDVSDPLKPSVVKTVRNPAIQFAHNAVPSPDGKLLVINDEAFAGHDCTTPAKVYGSLWIYDISDPADPKLAGRVAAPDGGAAPVGYTGVDLVGIDGRPLGPNSGWTRSWCAAHNYNFVPGTRILVSSWFTGGVTVEDLTDPAEPVRLAFWRASHSIAYTAHFHEGRIYVNDLYRGMDVLEVEGLQEGDGTGGTPAERLGARLRAKLPATASRLPVPSRLPARPALRLASERDTAFCVLPKAALPKLRGAAAL
jgi:hypothetical protein